MSDDTPFNRSRLGRDIRLAKELGFDVSEALEKEETYWMPRLLSKMNLCDLDSAYSEISKGLERQETRREVFVALWKAAPYGILTSFSAILYTMGMEQSYGLGNWLISVPITLTVGLILTSAICRRKSLDVSDEIANIKVIRELLQKNIDERLVLLKHSFRKWKDESSQIALVLDRFPLHPSEVIPCRKIDDIIGKNRSSDMAHRYYSIIEHVRQLETLNDRYLSLSIEYYENCKKAILETGGKIRRSDQGPIDWMVTAIYYIMADRSIETVNSSTSLEVERNVHGLLSKGLLSGPYWRILEDGTLNVTAKEIRETRDEGMLIYNDIIQEINYYLFDGENDLSCRMNDWHPNRFSTQQNPMSRDGLGEVYHAGS